MFDNILLDSDSYKHSHFRQYPPKTIHVYSYLESRGGKWPTTVFFGLQYILIRSLQGVVVTKEKIDQAESLIDQHMGKGNFNRKGWEHILKKHGGRLPVRIKAVPEGSEIPVSNILMSIENTDPEVPWLTNFLETCLMRIWYPLSVGSQSNEFKKLWLGYLEQSGTPGDVGFKLHDFGCRGVSTVEQAALGGLSHLLSFQGTDTLPALVAAKEFYSEPCAGFSIPASEHSTITAWGPTGEFDAYQNMLNQYPTGMFACVSDSYDIYNAVSKLWGGLLKDQVLARNGVVVIRPDSGTPETVVLDVVRRLEAAFGSEVNSKGYKVLNPKVRVIQGDGIDLDSAERILYKLSQWGYSADNIAMGSGGALLQKLNRDTQRCAIKASCVVVDGKERNVSKNPVTDAGKRSKSGRLKLIKTDKGYDTVPQDAPGVDILRTVFENGSLQNVTTLEECRKTLEETRIFKVPALLHPAAWG